VAVLSLGSKVEIHEQDPCIVRASCGRFRFEKMLPFDLACKDVWNTIDHQNAKLMAAFIDCIIDERAVLAEKGLYKAEQLRLFAREYGIAKAKFDLSGLFGTYVLKEGMNELGLVRLEAQEPVCSNAGIASTKSVAVLTVDLLQEKNTPENFEAALKLACLVFEHFRSQGLENTCTDVLYMFTASSNPWMDYGIDHALEKFGLNDTLARLVQVGTQKIISVYQRSFDKGDPPSQYQLSNSQPVLVGKQ